MILSHLRNYWTNHTAALSGAGISLFNGAAILQSILVGVGVFVITSGLKVAVRSVLEYFKRK